MAHLVRDSFRFTKPVVQSFEPAAKTALYARTAAWTATTAVAYAALKLIVSLASNQRAGRPLFSTLPFTGTMSVIKVIVPFAIGALVSYKLEQNRGIDAFQHEIANKSWSTFEEMDYLAKNPSAVMVALTKGTITSDYLLGAALKQNQFRSFKVVINYLVKQETPLTLQQFISTFPTPAFTSYVLRTEGALPVLSEDAFAKCWKAAEGKEVAHTLKTHKFGEVAK